MKRIIFTLLAVASLATASASEIDSVKVKAKAEPIFGITLVNQYIWRGLDMGNVCVQPTAGVSYKGLSFSTWGSVGFQSGDTKELDFLLSYTTHGFNVGITDYWFPCSGTPTLPVTTARTTAATGLTPAISSSLRRSRC